MLDKITFIRMDSRAVLPTRSHKGDAGLDLYAIEETIINVGKRFLLSTGLGVVVPYGFEAQIRSRSGLSWASGLIVNQGVGTVDHGYQGEVFVALRNVSDSDKIVRVGDRIAQLIIAPVALPVPIWGEDKVLTERGEGGFGSTGN
jgi:dUTP pyrophosphatase